MRSLALSCVMGLTVEARSEPGTLTLNGVGERTSVGSEVGLGGAVVTACVGRGVAVFGAGEAAVLAWLWLVGGSGVAGSGAGPEQALIKIVAIKKIKGIRRLPMAAYSFGFDVGLVNYSGGYRRIQAGKAVACLF